MDEIDDRILGILATNGRASFAAIGEEVGLSPHGAADRVRRLERDGVISGYAARIDPAGVGRSLHEDPQIPNYGQPGKGLPLKRGMVVAVEPMVNMGDWPTRALADGWTVVTADGSLSAHFEHTIALTANGREVLTARD